MTERGDPPQLPDYYTIDEAFDFDLAKLDVTRRRRL